MNNDLTHCWLSSSLAISAKERIDFLNKLVTNTLPASIKAQEKNIMYQETLPSGWELYGKTGSGYQRDDSGKKIKNRQVGWYVVFVRKGEKVMRFLQLIADDSPQKNYASTRAKAALKKNLSHIISGKTVLNSHHHRAR